MKLLVMQKISVHLVSTFNPTLRVYAVCFYFYFLYGLTEYHLINYTFAAAAVDAAGLADTLSGDGTFTVFAPNNDAFAKVPAEVVTKLLDPIWQPQLQDVSVYCVTLSFDQA